TVFGPKPRKYTVRMNKKTRQLARKSALSLKASADAVKVIEDFTFDQPKTCKIVELLESLDIAGKKVLLLTAETDKVVYKSARNIPEVQVLEANKATTYQLLDADIVLLQKSGVEVLQNSIEPISKEN